MRRCLRLISLLACFPLCVLAQETEEESSRPLILLDGRASVNVELYHTTRSSDTLPTSGRPPTLTRIDLSPTLHVGSISIPLRFGFSIVGDGEGNGAGERADLLDPANSLGISPSFGWKSGSLRLHLGSHLPEVSTLLGSRSRIFGGGFECALDSLEVRLSYGLATTEREALGPDDPARYRRAVGIGRISVGIEATRIGLNLLAAGDDTGSVTDRRSAPSPVRDYVAGLDGRTTIGSVEIDGEAAGSMFVGDLRSDTIEAGSLPEPARTAVRIAGIEPTISTTWGYAGRLRLAWRPTSLWNLGLEGDLTSVAFRSIANPWLPTNRLAVTLTPRFRTASGNLRVTGSIGVETPDPLTRQWGADRLNGAFTTVWREPFELTGMSVTTGYRYYGARTGSAPTFLDSVGGEVRPFSDPDSTGPDSSLSFTMSRHTFTFSPHRQFVSGGLFQTLGLQVSHTFGMQRRTGGETFRGSTSLGVMHTLTPRSSPLQITSSLTALFYVLDPPTDRTQAGAPPGITSTTLTGRLAAAYRLGRPGKNELTSSLALAHGGSLDGEAAQPTATSHTSLLLQSRWRATGSLLLTLRLQRSRYHFGGGEEWEEMSGRAGMEWGW